MIWKYNLFILHLIHYHRKGNLVAIMRLLPCDKITDLFVLIPGNSILDKLEE